MIDWIKARDWAVRGIKTFVQAFLGVVIPEIVAMLSGGFPPDLPTVWKVLAPFVSAGLAAAIAAVWNMWLEAQKK